jgi:hypothetical protein
MFKELKEDYRNNSMNPKRMQIKKNWENTELTKLKEDLSKHHNETKEIIFLKKEINERKKAIQDVKEELNKDMKSLKKKKKKPTQN